MYKSSVLLMIHRQFNAGGRQSPSQAAQGRGLTLPQRIDYRICDSNAESLDFASIGASPVTKGSGRVKTLPYSGYTI